MANYKKIYNTKELLIIDDPNIEDSLKRLKKISEIIRVKANAIAAVDLIESFKVDFDGSLDDFYYIAEQYNYTSKDLWIVWFKYDHSRLDLTDSFLKKCKEIYESNASIRKINNKKFHSLGTYKTTIKI